MLGGGAWSATFMTVPSSGCSASGWHFRLARGQLADGGRAVEELLVEAEQELEGTLDELRALARGIHPAVLTEEGLAPALETLARRASLPVQIESTPAERLPAPVEAAAYFVVSEALANVAKHAHAPHVTSRSSAKGARWSSRSRTMASAARIR
jgi:signal transduction histidine kinase